MSPELMLTLIIFFFVAVSIVAVSVLYKRGRTIELDETNRLQKKLDEAAQQIEQQQQQIIQLSGESRTDSLTQLPNRAAFEDELARRSAEVARYELEACLLVIDLDDFQKTKTQYGHSVGDVMLQHIAEIIRSQTRACDFAARMGADLFGVVLGHTQIEDAQGVASRLKKSIEGVEYQADGCDPVDIQVSIGLSSLADGSDDAILHAELALQQAKQGGKNKITVYDASPIVG